MNNIFKHGAKVDIDENYFLESDSFSGVVLVQHFPATKKNKEDKEIKYTKFDRWYFPTVSLALNQYQKLRQIILPSIEEMLEVQKETLGILERFESKYKNW